jgi:diguanylate cyclase (GGDEF)-like protein/PAS domain S-box-containing protein
VSGQRGDFTRSLGLAIVAAHTVVLAWLAFPHPYGNDGAIVAVCAAGYVCGALLLVLPERLTPDWFLRGVVAFATLLISAAVYFTGDSDAGLGLLYVWATPYAYVFFSARHAAAQSALVAVGLAVALLAQPWIPGAVGDYVSAQEPGRWLLVVATVVGVGSLVRRLTNSLRDSHDRLHQGFDNSLLGMALVSTDLRVLDANEALARMLGRTPEQMTGLSILDITLPEDGQLTLNARDAGLSQHKDRWQIEKRYVHADGTVVPVRIHTSLVRPAGGAPYFFGQVEDISERRAHEAERARRARQQEVVARLGQVALRGHSEPDTLMRETVSALAATLDVELSAVLEFDPGEQTLTFVAGVGWEPEVAAFTRFSVVERDSEGAYALASTAPVVVADLAGETRFCGTPLYMARGAVSGLSVVVEGAERPFGLLAAHSRAPRTFTADDVNFVQAVANVLSAATQRRRAEDRTRHAAVHDELTGLPNRRLALDRIGQALRRRGRSCGEVAVMMVDLDRFKVINDSLGHAAGDELLLALAPRLRAAVRPSDTVARLGGDEFVVVCEGLNDPRDAVAIAERIAAAIALPVILAGAPHRVSASIGIALAGCPDDTAGSLLRDADSALYRAKDRGRGRYELFDEPMREQVIRRMRTENELRRALDVGELRVHYQPVVNLADRRPVGVEALVRWQHPDRGLLGPGEFIAVAEESGQIGELGLWVLRESCRQAAEWQRSFAPGLSVSVNVSGRQVAQPGFPAKVTDVVRASDLAAGTLMLEITESVLIEEADTPMTVLSDLRDLDLRLVLDDFGTGFSSLSYLQRFPLDGLKIDRSFVAGLGTGGRDGSAIVDAVTRMASGLDLHLVAEGVETETQAARLAELGCTYAQGYLFARPMPAEQASEYLSRALTTPSPTD